MNNLFEFYDQFWNRQHEPLYYMERTGTRLDIAQLHESLDRALTHVSEYEEALNHWCTQEINYSSDKQVSEFLYDYKNLPIPPYMGSGQAVKLNREQKPSTSSVSLDWLAKHPDTSPNDREGIRQLMGRSKSVKMSQFLEALPRLARNGRIHTQLGPNTETGRLSSSKPNLQNIPKRNDRYQIRKAFVASPGHKLVVIDYSQLELYILAHYLISRYNDHSLAHDLTEGDVHENTALRCFGDLARRDDAKAVNYGIMYGKTGVGLGASLTDEHGVRIGKEAGQQIIDDYLDGYIGIRKFMADCITEGKATNKITTLLGRHRDLNWTYKNSTERKCANTRIQGSAADIVTTAMIRCFYDDELNALGTRMLLQVHDELMFEVPTENAEQCLARASTLMANPFRNFEMKLPLVVDGKIADNWLEGH